MQVESPHVRTSMASASAAQAGKLKSDESTIKSVDSVVTSPTDSVTLSSEAIALAEQEKQVIQAKQANGGDGNGELPEKPPKKP